MLREPFFFFVEQSRKDTLLRRVGEVFDPNWPVNFGNKVVRDWVALNGDFYCYRLGLTFGKGYRLSNAALCGSEKGSISCFFFFSSPLVCACRYCFLFRPCFLSFFLAIPLIILDFTLILVSRLITHAWMTARELHRCRWKSAPTCLWHWRFG